LISGTNLATTLKRGYSQNTGKAVKNVAGADVAANGFEGSGRDPGGRR
jgi:hypothetical protein